MDNADRFISAYNLVDKAIRTKLNLKANLSFTDVVRRGAAANALIQKYEDELLDYGRLRNAIVHSFGSGGIIARPYDAAVEEFEQIARLISSPPKASDFCKKAVTVEHTTRLKSAMAQMAASNYSNLPVTDNGVIIGVLSNKLIVEYLAKHLKSGLDEALKTATVSNALTADARHYAFKTDKCGIDEILHEFSKNRKLSIILLTSNGGSNGVLTGVITISNLIDIKLL